MPDILFRKPESSDLPQLQPLVDAFFNTHAVPGLRKRPDIALSVANFEKSPGQGEVVVFESDGAIIGYAILIAYWSNEYGGNIIVIDELFVKSEYGDQGIPAYFFSWVEDRFSNEAVGMSVQVSHVNERDAKLYSDRGFLNFPCNNVLKVFSREGSESDPPEEESC